MAKCIELVQVRSLLGMRYQKELAHSLDYQPSYYCDVENGHKSVTVELLLRLVERHGEALPPSLIEALADKAAAGLGRLLHQRSEQTAGDAVYVECTGEVHAGRYISWAKQQPDDAADAPSATDLQSIPVPRSCLDANHEYMAVTAKGNSMVYFGILDRDTLVVAKNDFAPDGSLVIVETVFGDRLVKRIKDNGKQYLLESGNIAEPVMVLDKSDCRILGRVRHVLRFNL